jgi:hypothetical protein
MKTLNLILAVALTASPISGQTCEESRETKYWNSIRSPDYKSRNFNPLWQGLYLKKTFENIERDLTAEAAEALECPQLIDYVINDFKKEKDKLPNYVHRINQSWVWLNKSLYTTLK